IEPVKEFRPPMLLEARGEDYDLGYLDLNKKRWKKFKTQGKENGTAWAKIKYWADDPQVAWGY
ncbi:MAG: hypothetical protein U9R58_06885, partial [Chloroflexota bacterium]|nr:hypothetical protein [Chloroflexota bacterium]